MPTRIYLVRHGATDLTAEDRFAGSTEVPLSEEGRRQAAALAERLRCDTLDGIYASPMGRTMETARIIAAPHGCEVRPEPDLREIAYGHWEERTRDEIEQAFSDEYDAWQEDPLTIAPAGGESGVQVLARALPVIRRIVQEHRHRSVLIVSHKGTNRLLISSLLGFDARGYRDRLDQSPAALNILEFANDVRARLKLFNDISHYDRLPERCFEQRLSRWWSAPEQSGDDA
ncbi:histidine phosphatase family protein [Thiorhodococcus mannitoliphagus]|uniref:Histidine phosphatase family protein n=1 Tax=Thiorhodococcus mannitoliphagus TaxID=329406 RepID=A0A6P1DXK2_9GAMM|nr:histidine phosphatase family protein [Thiorhodococcus mannitoliphagus]NEX22918.1 histidine phosphatase family protein [Thiorhodococcus mannitoliphagus]